jgi:hypothetical protein
MLKFWMEHRLLAKLLGLFIFVFNPFLILGLNLWMAGKEFAYHMATFFTDIREGWSLGWQVLTKRIEDLN